MSLQGSQTEVVGTDVVQSAPHVQMNVFASIVRFLHLVRMRRGIMISWMAASLIVGAIYYAVAPRLYDSTAQIYVVRNAGGDTRVDQGGVFTEILRTLPTHARNMASQRVLAEALTKLPPEYRVDFGKAREQNWPDIVRKNLRVSYDKNSAQIDLTYRSLDPVAAKEMLTAILAAYQSFVNQTSREGAAVDLSSLRADRDNYQKQILARRLKLSQLTESLGILPQSNGQYVDTNAVRIQELESELTRAQASVREAESFRAAVDQAIEKNQDLVQLAVQSLGQAAQKLLDQELGGGPSNQEQLLYNQMMQRLIGYYTELQNAQQDLLPNHPRMKELRSQIEITRTWLDSARSRQEQKIQEIREQHLVTRLREAAWQQLVQASNRERSVRSELASVRAEFDRGAAARIEMATLETQIEQDKVSLASVENSINSYGTTGGRDLLTQITRHPLVPNGPASPRLILVAAVAVFCGVFFGATTVYVLDVLDDRFRSPEELRVQLGVPVLAMIRQMEPTGKQGVESINTLVRPNGVETEAFRTLRTSVSFAETATQRIMVTSSEPGDGKTTVMANLAVAYAQSGRKTLLIDADMRRPGMSTLLDLRGPKGLSHVLRDDAPIDQSAVANRVETITEGLDFIASGSRPVNPAELLASERFSELLAWAETVYDQILVDAPPVLAVADPTIIGRIVDGVVLVIRPGKNRRKMVIRAAESLSTVDINLLGLAVNRITGDINGDYYGYGYGYGYGHGYGYGYGGYGYGHGQDDDTNASPGVAASGEMNEAESSDQSEEPTTVQMPDRAAA